MGLSVLCLWMLCVQWVDAEAPWAAGQAAVSRSTHLLSLVSPGFGGPALTPLGSPRRAAAVLQDKGLWWGGASPLCCP